MPSVPFAAEYPLLNLLWTMLIFFAFVIWLWILFTVVVDLFRRDDTSGWGKALWLFFLIILPYLGVFIYLITQHKGMTERNIAQRKEAESQFADYVKSVAPAADPAEQIAKGKELLDTGAITQAEFDELKRKALAGS
ncbi:MAG TPA: PLDc N-terminal domain-containing protein [Capillimicrobium sp.]|nr:PLDc N-terminal domain-containing protein [Capillimicrobium sp.]